MSAQSPKSLLYELLARCRFPAGSTLHCAVSGGADSLALLALACETGRNVVATHVDHGQRPDSANDADAVAAVADRFGARMERRTVTVAVGPNLEARMRAARFAVLPASVLTGHTADDQAETVLLNLMRGAGTAGMAGMSAERHPILGLRRFETHALCNALSLTPIVDPSNSDASFRRNRVRLELLPLMDDIAARDVAAVIAANALHTREDAELLDALARQVDPTDCAALNAAPVALARRALRLWLTDADGYSPDAAGIDRVMTVVAGHVKACELANGRRVSRSRQRLSVSGATTERR